MKKTSFLAKLHTEGKLGIAEPSEIMKTAYLERSNESLSSAKALFRIGNLKDSIILSYYAMYHSLLALLFRVGIKCENHAAAIVLLSELFGIDNMPISKAKSERVDKQYYVDFEVNEKEVGESIKNAEEFMAFLTDFIEKLNEEKIQGYRKKADNLIR
jgi:uncharacterized protein (UPF0332 family)